MSRYVLKFRKFGYVKYISHLDLLRVFKRTFKKTDLQLRYSQGFNPHPRMGFAQPLSLGYSSQYELVEFETVADHEPEDILKKMQEALPEGIDPLSCQRFDSNVKSLAGETDSAEYTAWIPVPQSQQGIWNDAKATEQVEHYLQQTKIFAMKRQKKTKKMVSSDIRPQIRNLSGRMILLLDENENKTGTWLELTMLLDCGSTSNLSPELVLNTFCSFADLHVPRYEMEVERKKINFVNKLQF
ncbi:MAG: TIGR03936 family radical SAM-associated protein [Firmicutes bacterium]|nr:TIGR03936 family radical SAM-associated protein [Bacillota bacterium]MDD7601996.1 TIGR03936 family radical SAM-associated protein [Bacillota bacterium]MDY5856012.1 TIGR03936 family radical SAM-associated protein [Anaerovoracaceae bacterium]